MSDKQDYGDGVMLIAVILMILAFVLWTYMFEWFFAAWYAIKAPLYNSIGYIPKSFFDVFFNWSFLDGTIAQPIYISIKSFGESLYSIAELFTKINFEKIMDYENFEVYLKDNYSVDLKQFISIVNSITIKLILIPFYIPLFIYLAIKINNKERFNTVHTVESLGIQESDIWPQIKPIIYEYDNLVNTKDLDSGPHAMAAKPKDYMKKHDLLEKVQNTDENDIENYKKYYYKLNKEKSYNHLVKNLGKKWTNVYDLSFEKKALISIMVPKLMRNPALSRKMNDNLARMHSSYPEKKNFSFIKYFKIIKKDGTKEAKEYKNKIKNGNKIRKKILKEIKIVEKIVKSDIDAIFEKYFPKDIYKNKSIFSKEKILIKGEIDPKIKNIFDHHFYESTVFSRLLKETRTTGVLASCEFIWLKKVNRELWYVMSQVGRTACFVECSGVWSHYLTEVAVGRKLCSPMVVNAIKAFDKYMYYTHDLYIPIGRYED